MTSAPAPSVLLANELGAGRGHLVTLARVARALGPGLPLIAAVGSLRHRAELEAAGVRVQRCPLLCYTPEMKRDPRLVGNATWACYLAGSGFVREDVLRRSLAFWRALIVEHDISILVADYAPAAMRAALGLKEEGWDIRIIAVGTGYGVPPAGLDRFPPTTPGFDRIIHPEESVLDCLNRVGADLGLSPLPRLSALYDVDLALPATFDFLDPYARWRPASALVPPLVDRTEDLAGAGDEVFVYFSRDEADRPGLAEALCRLPLPRRGYLPAASEAAKDRLAASGMIVETAPVPPALIAARSRLIVHPSPHGTLCTAALAGLPQLGLPGHKEQATHAGLAEAAQVMRVLPPKAASTEAILGAARDLYEDAAASRAARDLALRLRQDFPADPQADLAARLAPEVEIARSFVTG